MTRIAIEATGCDKGFGTVLEGARKAIERNGDLELVLVAGKDKLNGHSPLPEGISLELAEYTYDSNNKGQRAESSIYHAIRIHKSGVVDAVIAPGDTRGTIMASCKLLGLMPNVLSPAIPTHWPRTNVLIDSGANIECKPENMFQFAIMGKVYSENYLGVGRPLIGVLTNGVEGSKGNRLIRKSRRLIDKLKNNGYGISENYFEGDFIKDLDAGRVVVTDGHTGNIVLKIAEEAIKTSFGCLYEETRKQHLILQLFAKIGMHVPIKNIKQQLHYENYAVAPLLGVRGNILISHGKSDEKAIANAVELTQKYLKCNVNSKLEEEMMMYGKV